MTIYHPLLKSSSTRRCFDRRRPEHHLGVICASSICPWEHLCVGASSGLGVGGDGAWHERAGRSALRPALLLPSARVANRVVAGDRAHLLRPLYDGRRIHLLITFGPGS